MHHLGPPDDSSLCPLINNQYAGRWQNTGAATPEKHLPIPPHPHKCHEF